MATVITSVAASAGAVNFPGCNFRREDLEQELHTRDDHDHFAWKLSRCPGSTLGDIVSNCNEKATAAQFAIERWGRFENLWWTLSIMGGPTLACSTMMGLAELAVTEPQHLALALGLIGASTAALATGVIGMHMINRYKDQERLAQNVRNEVKEWGTRLGAGGATPSPTPPIRLEDQLRMLDPEEKKRLAARLTEQAQAVKNEEAQPHIVRGDATVSINGVAVPVRQPDGPVSQSQ